LPIGDWDCRLAIWIADWRFGLPIADWIADWRLELPIAHWCRYTADPLVFHVPIGNQKSNRQSSMKSAINNPIGNHQ
jgi:hypothetical protein